MQRPWPTNRQPGTTAITDVLRLLISGVLANKHLQGGAAWTRLNWILGFKSLGVDVCFVEQIDPEGCRDATGRVTSFQNSENRKYFESVTDEFGLSSAAALVFNEGDETAGMSYGQLTEFADAADLLVNISGHLKMDDLVRRVKRRIYVDLDPGFTQYWQANGLLGPSLAKHHRHFTVGENIGRTSCQIPTGGIDWRPVRQPVVLEHWPVTTCKGPTRFTTVSSWRGPFAPIRNDAACFGLKHHEFRKFFELPALVPATFELALSIDAADDKDRKRLHEHRWSIVNPVDVVPDPQSFRHYIQSSHAEFSVAHGIYVETHSGWFSDRTVRYLASGKPVLIQDTGYSDNLPTGCGLVPFRSKADAVAGANDIMDNYDRHCLEARRIAEDVFDSEKVLGKLLEEALD